MLGDDGRVVACVALLALVATAGAPLAEGPGGLAAAGHEPATTNFTYTPLDRADRQPGAGDIRVGTIGTSGPAVDVDFETLLELRSVYEAGSWEGCGPTSSEVFGIDRGSDNPRYEVDERLADNVKSFSAGEDVFSAEFYDEDDIGQSTHLNAEDRVYSVIDCPNNPETAGWYQIDNASVTGRTASGEVRTVSAPSHYVWICDCEDAAAAREQLGPKPSADLTPTPTPTATEPAGTPEPDGVGDAGAGPTPTRTADREGSTTPTPSAPPAPGGTATPTRSPTGTVGGSPTASGTRPPEDWDDYLETPTVAAGPGFGPLSGLAAMAVAVLVALGRRP